MFAPPLTRHAGRLFAGDEPFIGADRRLIVRFLLLLLRSCRVRLRRVAEDDDGRLLFRSPEKGTPPTLYPLYKDAVKAVQAAVQQGGVLKGIIWHQGESDYRGRGFTKEAYAAALTELIANLRTDLNAPQVPFVMGELGEFLDQKTVPFAPVNEALHEVAAKVPKVGVASSEGLKTKGDNLHFDTPSQRLFGQRYAAEMLRLQKLP